MTDINLKPHAVGTGSEALAYLRSPGTDLIILDLQLPERDALDLTLELRRLPGGESAALLLLTSTPLRRDDPRLRNANASGAIFKPIRRSQLYRALRGVAFPEEPDPQTTASHAFDRSLAERLPLRILLADDHEVNQKVGTRILQGFGYRCEIAGNGLEVLQALERHPFDIVFLDVQMPEMDGYETAKQIRRRWNERERPRLIAMTANALVGDREKCLEAGMDDYIAKPVEIGQIRNSLERWGNPAVNLQPAANLPAEQPAPGTYRQPATSDASIDWDRFQEMLGDDPKTVREFLDLYFHHTETQIQQLQAALQAANAGEVQMLAHRCKGASATCGVTSVALPMKKLESAAQSGDLSQATRLLAEARDSFGRVREILLERLRSLESSSASSTK